MRTLESDIVVLDVEGTDGRERGEDQVQQIETSTGKLNFAGFREEKRTFFVGSSTGPYY